MLEKLANKIDKFVPKHFAKLEMTANLHAYQETLS